MASVSLVPSSSQGFIVPSSGLGLVPSNLVSSGVAPPPVNFITQVTISEHHHDEMEIEQHPIQIGAPIVDHAYVKPAELTLNMVFVPSAGPASGGLEATNYIQYVYLQLEQGKSNRQLYTVYTKKRVYTNMLIKAITTMTDASKQNILEITLNMFQLLLTSPIGIQGVTAQPVNQASPEDTNPVTPQGFLVATQQSSS